ncbi:hypothetical protein HG530_009930 [Fusarium avenaceum]|nr:hypothetical protein HG530_009930 [Fusarium avenaceum]
MTSRQNISSGSAFEELIGYSRAVVTGDWVFVSGTTGYDYKSGQISADVTEQADQTMTNIAAALKDAGASVSDVVRVRYILPDRDDFPKTWPVLKKWFGDVRPAATMVQSALMKEEMKIEIEWARGAIKLPAVNAVLMVTRLDVDIIDRPLTPCPEVQPPANLEPTIIRKPPDAASQALVSTTSRGTKDGKTLVMAQAPVAIPVANSVFCRLVGQDAPRHGATDEDREKLGDTDKKTTASGEK